MRGGCAGVGEHTDYGLLTLLYQDEVGGLQVKHGSAGSTCRTFPARSSSTSGTCWSASRPGRYTSALHRVINTSGRPRISMPFFFDPRFDAELRPIHGRREPRPFGAS